MKAFVPGVLVLLLVGCGGDGPPTVPAPPQAALAIVSGNGQQGISGQLLAQPFVVRVTARGTGVPGLAVRWTITSGVGEFAAPAANSRTASDGVATMSFRPTMPSPGTVTAEVTGAQGSPATFTVNVTGGPVVVLIRFSPLFDCTANDPSLFQAPAGDILLGSLVEFEYMDWVHDSCSARIRSVSLPAGAVSFESAVLKPGQRFGVLVNVAGDWKYGDVINGGGGTLRVR